MTLKNSPVADDLLATPITRTSARNLSDSGSPDTDCMDGASSKNGRDEDFNTTLMQIQEFSHTLHERNQKRIKAGLWCIAIIPIAAYGEFKGCVSFIMGNFTLFNFCISGNSRLH